MQERIESGLLVVVTILSVVLLIIGQKKSSGMTKKQKVMLWRIFIATILLLGLQTLGVEAFNRLGTAGRWIRLALYLIDYLIIGYDKLPDTGMTSGAWLRVSQFACIFLCTALLVYSYRKERRQ